MIAVTGKQFINYAVLPGFRPRLAHLFATGFHYIPFFIAMVYQAVRLLPKNHPYTQPVNIGRYGIRHVIAEAANHLVFKRQNLDQIILFAVILFGLVITLVQFLLLGFSIFSQPALAQLPTGFSGFFGTEDATQDLAFIFLDLVFGIPDLFGSCVGVAEICKDANGREILLPNQGTDGGGEWILSDLGWPHPIHNGLHSMFQIYSIGLLVVAALITSYFVFTVVAETAQSGTPFGKRFNKVWAPLRIVMAFGLLVPVGYGMNSAQYIVLYAAKYGSGFATNGWVLFNETLNSETQGYLESGKMLSRPNPPEVGGLLQFMYVAKTCKFAYKFLPNGKNKDIRFYVVKDTLTVPNRIQIATTIPDDDGTSDDETETLSTYAQLLDFLNGANKATIVFGYVDPKPKPEDYLLYRAHVAPLCGELVLNLTDSRKPNSADNPPEPGLAAMQAYYWFILKELWFGYEFDENDDVFYDFPEKTAKKYIDRFDAPLNHGENYKPYLQGFYANDLRQMMKGPSYESLTELEPAIVREGALPAMAASGRWAINTDLKRKGWAGGAIWYNRIAEMNGALTSAFLNIPLPSKYPMVMEHVKRQKMQNDSTVTIDERFEPKLSGGKAINYLRGEDSDIAEALWVAFRYWQTGEHVSTPHTTNTQNAFIEAITGLFGTEGLYSMRNNTNTHPLAQLVGIGRSLVESSVRNIGYATIGGVGGFVGSFLGSVPAGEAGKVAINFFMTIAMITLTVGFILYYIVPFLPFIYFFFALGGWIKGIFEAMIGAPLWALAHIRIDGEGLPGQAAVNGYFLIFEIFLRPILIVFGLLASISIFSALISVLNEIWDIVTSNVSGFDVKTEIESGDNQNVLPKIDYYRNPVDQFFFTVVYALIAYLMAMSSFKLIDLVPNNILRWMGQSVQTFNDQREDPAQGLTGTATIGAQQTISNIGGGYKGALSGIAGLGAKKPGA